MKPEKTPEKTIEMTPEMVAVLASLKMGNLRRHIILCAGPKCCSSADGEQVWQHLKARLADAKVGGAGLFRTKAVCLRICREGPVALVYPEGVWYRLVSKEVCDRIIDEHLLNGMPVTEYMITANPLAPAKDS